MKKILSFLFIFFVLKLSATHIIGGLITYKHTKDDVFNFTLKIYRDCSVSSQFSSNITIPAYLGARNSPFLTQNVTLNKADIIKINPPNFPCVIIPDNICVEEATYYWTMRLPKSTESYYVSYQVCCRNETINNIINPSYYGGTFTTEITPIAQNIENQSPEFKVFPPTAICVNTFLEFNNGALDADGDLLLYEFCAPLEGIVKNGLRCKELITNNEIACPPPYPVLPFVGNCSALNPLGDKSILKIDPKTGILTGTPTEIGQYVVGICVKEIRNGEVVGMTTRDFQFNVIQCEKSVIGNIVSDSINKDGIFLIKNCSDKSIKIYNKSRERAYIKDYYWEFDFDLNTKYRDWEPFVTLPDTGVFEGRLILNPNLKCIDTARVIITYSYTNEAKFTIQYDTCNALKPVVFVPNIDTSKIGIKNFKWSIDAQKDTIANILKYNFDKTGKKNVRLKVENLQGCTAVVEKDFYWQPSPSALLFRPNAYIQCTPATFFIENLSRPIDSSYTIEWNFNDGKTENGLNAFHTYKSSGLYTLGLKITSPLGCVANTNFTNFFRVEQAPSSNFEIEPQKLNADKPIATFTNLSKNASNVKWLIDNKDLRDENSPFYTFRDTGLHTVLMIARNTNGCLDSIRKTIYVYPFRKWFLPNVFTPNYDTHNDEYKGKGVMDDNSNFEMQIFNSWGIVVFSTKNANEGWNGLLNNNGNAMPNGKYIAKVTYLDYDNTPISIISNVFLIK
jgi:gliding motility-associated-like protein